MPADPRTFGRGGLAVVAPLPWLALAVSTIVTPDRVRDDDQQAYAAIAAHTTRAAIGFPFSALFIALLFPAVLAVLLACQRGAPRLTVWVGVITLAGAAAAPLVPAATLNDYVAATKGLDRATVATLNTGVGAQPVGAVALLLFLLGVILGGRILLGVLLWRSHIAPRWTAIALIISAPLDVFGPSGRLLHNDNAWLSYLLTAIGFAAAAWTLWRPGNGPAPSFTRSSELAGNG